jgi:hypothetical protein
MEVLGIALSFIARFNHHRTGPPNKNNITAKPNIARAISFSIDIQPMTADKGIKPRRTAAPAIDKTVARRADPTR